MINVLFAINNNQLDDFLDNWKTNAEGTRLNTSFSVYQTPTYELNPYLLTQAPQSAQGQWKVNGADNKTLVTLYVADVAEPDWTDPDDLKPKDILSVVKILMDTFQGSLVILGAFKPDGLQHGLTLVQATYDTEGTELTPEEITGTATYQVRQRDNAIAYMPDVVTHDQDGYETSRTDATELTDVNLVAGWASRVW